MRKFTLCIFLVLSLQAFGQFAGQWNPINQEAGICYPNSPLTVTQNGEAVAMFGTYSSSCPSLLVGMSFTGSGTIYASDASSMSIVIYSVNVEGDFIVTGNTAVIQFSHPWHLQQLGGSILGVSLVGLVLMAFIAY